MRKSVCRRLSKTLAIKIYEGNLSEKEDPISMSPDLSRQRRNLLIISILIIIFAEGGVSIQGINFIGLNLEFKNFDIIYTALWVVFFYFLSRYYQYCREEPNLGIFDSYTEYLDHKCWQKIRTLSIVAIPTCEKYGGEYYFSKTEKTGFMKRKIKVYSSRKDFGELVTKHFEISIVQFVPDILLSLLNTLVNRKGISDYILPFIVSFCAFLYAFSHLWEGSIINLVKVG